MRTFLFLFGLIALIVIVLVLNAKGLFSPKDEINARFSPKEIATMVKKNSVDYIAGECEAKEFKLEKEKNTSGKAMDYEFFYLGNVDYLAWRDVNTYMKEKITTWDSDHSINYTFRDKKKYLEYIDYLQMHKQIMLDTLAPYSSLLTDSTYLFEDCLFQDIGYSMNDNGFVIHGESITNFVAYQKQLEKTALGKKLEEENAKAAARKKAEPKPEPEPEQVTSSSVAYIDVNVATVFREQSDVFELRSENGTIVKLKKGAKLKIKKQGSNFYYCDFTDANGIANTGWIKRDDIKYNPFDN